MESQHKMEYIARVVCPSPNANYYELYPLCLNISTGKKERRGEIEFPCTV